MAEISDILRVINVLLYAIAMTQALWISLTYYDKYKRSTDWHGLLPHHVYLIGTSYILYSTSALGYSLAKFGEVLSPFGFLNLVAGASGIYALNLVTRYGKKSE